MGCVFFIGFLYYNTFKKKVKADFVDRSKKTKNKLFDIFPVSWYNSIKAFF